MTALETRILVIDLSGTPEMPYSILQERTIDPSGT